MYSSLLTAAGLMAYVSAIPISQPQVSHVSKPLRRETGEVVTGSAAVLTLNDNDGTQGSDTYTLYTGDGSSWPPTSSWQSFSTMFDANTAIMSQSCTQWSQDNDSSQETDDIRQAIEDAASATHLDHRFILAIMMQESNGCVRVPTTGNGVTNPGLMQDHDGDGTCWNNGVGTNPCPSDEISLMISEGAAGTAAGDGLAATVNRKFILLLHTFSRLNFQQKLRIPTPPVTQGPITLALASTTLALWIPPVTLAQEARHIAMLRT